MSNLDFMWNLKSLEDTIEFIKLYIIVFFTFYVYTKITNKKFTKFKNIIVILLVTSIISYICLKTEIYIGIYCKWMILIVLVEIVNIINYGDKNINSLSCTIIAFIINYVIYVLAIMISFFPNAVFKIENDYVGGLIIISIYFLLLYKTFKIKKLKYGMQFLQKKTEDLYFNILVLNIGAITLIASVILESYSGLGRGKVGICFLAVAISMVITLKKSFDLYYKQKLLQKDLEQTKEELEETKKELENANKDNIEISGKMHSLNHRQKALQYQLEKLEKAGIDNKETKKVEEQLQNISKDMYQEPDDVELTKTDILAVDNMLEYMKSECKEKDIKFELQVEGNIHYMVNNLITENDLEILIADHVKDAIIAINSSDNSNKSILVILGKIDEFYGIVIYDTGVEFTKEVLEKLGKEPITTHKDEGGTGMGFMNTFDTLKRTKASLIIKEIGEPSIDNYTKAVVIKFDGKNEFQVESYKKELECIN